MNAFDLELVEHRLKFKTSNVKCHLNIVVKRTSQTNYSNAIVGAVRGHRISGYFSHDFCYKSANCHGRWK